MEKGEQPCNKCNNEVPALRGKRGREREREGERGREGERECELEPKNIGISTAAGAYKWA